MNVDEMFERLNPTLFEKSSFIPNMWDRYVRGQVHLSSMSQPQENRTSLNLALC
jgi:hypothetical protein